MSDKRIELRNGIQVLSEKELKTIHDASCKILAEVGVNVEHPRLLKCLEAIGADVNYSASLVKFPGKLVERYLAEAKKKAQGAKHDPAQLPRETGISLGGGQSLIYDPQTDAIRAATKKDLESSVIIGDYYPEIKGISNLINPTDAPGEVNDLHIWEVLVTRTAKFTGAHVLNRGSARFIMELLAVAVGSVEEVKRRQMFKKNCFMYSPLKLTKDVMDIGFEMLDLGMPIVIGHPLPPMGGSSPITIAGTLALVNAETIAGIIMTMSLGQKSYRPYYSGAPVAMDLRSGIALAATPEFILVNCGAASLARYYGLTSHVYGAGHTDAPVPDFQSGFERGASAMLGLLFGNESMCGGTLGPSNEVVCLEKIVLDIDSVKYFNRLLRGIEVTDETIALDLIKAIGPGGNYFAEPHTVEHMRAEVWTPETFVHMKPSEYNQTKKIALEHAKDKVKQILKEHDPHPLSPDQEKEIRAIVKKAEQAKGVD